jgi:hypothetical protein
MKEVVFELLLREHKQLTEHKQKEGASQATDE